MCSFNKFGSDPELDIFRQDKISQNVTGNLGCVSHKRNIRYNIPQ